ncbi:MAG: hypothetical protein P8M25_15225 [Paracoccaceae bacterium]|nr:hypothetical protein [Paracoccaceae bacterium]
MAKARGVSIGLKKTFAEGTAGTSTMEEMMAGDRAELAAPTTAVFGYGCAGPKSQSSSFSHGVTTNKVFKDTHNDTSGHRPALV